MIMATLGSTDMNCNGVMRRRTAAWVLAAVIASLAGAVSSGPAAAADPPPVAAAAPVATAAASSAWDKSLSAAIDREIAAAQAAAKVTAAGRADDITLHRRIHLDLLGRIPTVAETEAFVADTSSTKVHSLIDRLLVHPEMPVHWRRVIQSWLQMGRTGNGHGDSVAWLEGSIADNKPWDTIAMEMLVPEAAVASRPELAKGAGFFLGAPMQGGDRLDLVTVRVSSGLFGVQLQCAKCHDHPSVPDWRQEHYYGLAAFFNRTDAKWDKDKGYLFTDRPQGEVKFFTTEKAEKVAPAMFLDSAVVDPVAPPAAAPPANAVAAAANTTAPAAAPPATAPGNAVATTAASPAAGRRQRLVEHAIRGPSPFFRNSIVNRIWKQLMGRGLVEPVDQMHSENPPTHPAVLDLLSADLLEHRYDLRRLLAGILHSEAYLRSTNWNAPGGAARPADETYATAILKPLSGEQMIWSIEVATKSLERQAATPAVAKELKLPAPPGGFSPDLRRRVEMNAHSHFESRVAKFAAVAEDFQADVAQALWLTFNPMAGHMIRPLATDLAAEKDPAALVRRAYVGILAREPTAEEQSEAQALVAAAGEAKKGEGCVDLVWALVSSAEFRFNH